MFDDTPDQQDELLRSLAADFREPPPVPREEIWARIQAERAAGPAPRTVLPFRPVSHRRSAVVRSLTWAAGVAALIAVGIGVGRLIPVGRPDAPPAPTADAGDRSVAERDDAVLGMAVRQYLSRTETLLTGMRAGDPTEDFVAVARDLLGMTRLLLDSPALTDRTTRELLDDLELILAQVTVLSASGDREQDRNLIAAGMADRNLMPRLRTALPASLASAPAVYGEL